MKQRIKTTWSKWKESIMENKKQKTKNKFYKKLTKIGFKKIPSDDGFVMYELTPSNFGKAVKQGSKRNK